MATLQLTEGVRWSTEVVAGTVLLSALTAVAAAILIARGE